METQTVDLSDLNIISDASVNVCIEQFIESGDMVRYFCDDSQEYRMGYYMTLWFYLTDGRETSPFVADTRMMAKIATVQGGVTFADCNTIAKPVNPIQNAKV
jgi:hypothetical protein